MWGLLPPGPLVCAMVLPTGEVCHMMSTSLLYELAMPKGNLGLPGLVIAVWAARFCALSVLRRCTRPACHLSLTFPLFYSSAINAAPPQLQPAHR